MSLRQLAATIEQDIGLLRDSARLVRDLQEYAGLSAELAELAEVVGGIVRDANVLRAGGVEPTMSVLTVDASAALRSLTSDGVIIDGPSARARSALKEIRTWTTEHRRRLLDTYRSWFDAEFPDLDGTEAFATQLSRLGVPEGVRIRALVLGARTKRNVIPNSPHDFDDVRTFAIKLKEATEAFAPTESVRDFVRALLDEGAQIGLYSPEVQAWAKERGLVGSLRIRLTRDTGA